MEHQKIYQIAEQLKIADLEVTTSKIRSQEIKYSDQKFEKIFLKDLDIVELATFINGNKLTRKISRPKAANILEALKEMQEFSKYKTKEINQEPLSPSKLVYSEVPSVSFQPLEIKKIKDMMANLAIKVNQAHPNIDSKNTVIEYYFQEVKSHKTNSKGLDLFSEQGKILSLVIEVFGTKNDVKADFLTTRLFKNANEINFDEIAKEVASEMERKINQIQIEQGNYEIVFNNNAFLSLLEPFLIHLKAQAVIDKYSRWSNLLNQKIASSKLTLVDKPIFEPFGLFLSYDGDGFPTKENKFIDQGILKSFVHNQKTATILEQENTGNSTGQATSFHNLILEPGQSSKTDIFSQVKKGVLIDDFKGLHSGTNPISGDFSLEFSGNLIVNGEIKKGIKAAIIAGNIFEDVLPHVQEISKHLEYSKNYASGIVRLDKELPISI